jgi:hypothetical protein
MSPERELYLHEEFIGVKLIGVTSESVLASNLCKLARPVGQDQ